jgi:hypothetical protein
MEKVVALFESMDMGAKEYEAILKEMETRGVLYNPKRLSHVSFIRDGKWCVVDVWESAEAVKEFGQNVLGPIFSKIGLNPPQLTVLPAYRYMGAHADESVSA